jgi:cellulose synthase/poly-beta-1,6-N-acetylglucosamine synthase-like glycosyltransferase
MSAWHYIFTISCFLVFYNYVGYAIIAWCINLFSKRKETIAGSAGYFPTVSFIVAAYNEEDCIRQKIVNSLEQDYPREKIEFIFITDGSTDKTMDIIRNYPSLRLLHLNERKGKSAALNRVASLANNEILVFSDANTLLNRDATRLIARHYQDKKVGGVAGEKKVLPSSDINNEPGVGEGFYWKYESLLKKIDSDFYSVVGAAGELFSLRNELYEEIPDEVILDDFIISMRIAQKGFRIRYEPQAYAMELPSDSLKDEQKRKIRIAAGGFQSIVMLRPLLKFWKYPPLSFLYISHRVMRWMVSPVCLILAFVSNLVLFLQSNNYVFKLFFIFQVVFYLMAVFSAFVPIKNKWLKICKLSYYFVFMNYSVIQGLFRYLRGRQPATWEKAKRTQPVFHIKQT